MSGRLAARRVRRKSCSLFTELFRSDSEGIEPDEAVQVDLAIRMLKALYRAEESASARLFLSVCKQA